MSADRSPTGAIEHLMQTLIDEQRAGWQHGNRSRVEEHLERYPALAEHPDALLDLIYNEIVLREEHGESPRLEEFLQRFPHLTEPLRDQFAVHAALKDSEGLSSVVLESETVEVPGHEVLEEIARGGMGIVLRVRDCELRRELAVKTLRSDLRHHDVARQRFLEEAHIAAQLQHPGLVPIHKIGSLSDGRPFFTMKLIKGRTLTQLLLERGSPSEVLPQFLKVFQQVCDTLAYAHSRYVIHRDLKPENVMVGAFGEVHVMDWGLAKVLTEERAGIGASASVQWSDTHVDTPREQDTSWKTEAALGTFAYLSPEQARGQTDWLDERCDVFGLGAILCEIFTGQPPYDGSTRQQVQNQALVADPVPVHKRLEKSSADPELIELAKRCLSEKREERPRNASEVARVISDHRAYVEEKLRQSQLETAQAEVRAEEERKRRKVERQKRRATLALMASILLLVLGGGIVAWWIQDVRSRNLAEKTSKIARALTQAETLQGQADAVKLRTLADWRDQEELLRLALKITGEARASFPTDESLMEWDQRLAAQQNESSKKLAIVTKQRRMHEQLDRAFERRGMILDGDYDSSTTEVVVFGHTGVEVYVEAFQEYGVDVLNLKAGEAAELLRQSPIRDRIGEALTDWLLLSRKDPEAMHLLQIVQVVDPDPVRGQIRAALLKEDTENLRGLAEKIGVDSVTTVLPLADALQMLRAYDDAIALLKRARDVHPNSFWINDVLGVLVLSTHAHLTHEAILYLECARSLRPDAFFVYSNLASAHGMLGNWSRADKLCEQGLRLKPTDLRLQMGRVEVLIARQKLGEAERICREYLASRASSSAARSTLSQVLFAKGDFAGAESQAAAALRSNPNSFLATQIRGSALIGQKNYADAIDLGKKAIQLNGQLPFGYQLLGRAYFHVDQTDQAIQWLREGLRKVRQSFDLRVDLASAYAARGKLDEAIEELSKISAMDSGFRYRAAGLAVFIAAQKDGPTIVVKKEAGKKLRDQALKWLRADLDACRALLDLDFGRARLHVSAVLTQSKSFPQLAGVRELLQFSKLPKEEQETWKQLWRDVDTLLTKAQQEHEVCW